MISLVETLSHLPEINFQPCVIPVVFTNVAADLHHFCDGSQVGFWACSYIRSVSPPGKILVALVTAKSRLAPLKQVSIPRLELSAAVISVELDTLLPGNWMFTWLVPCSGLTVRLLGIILITSQTSKRSLWIIHIFLVVESRAVFQALVTAERGAVWVVYLEGSDI